MHPENRRALPARSKLSPLPESGFSKAFRAIVVAGGVFVSGCVSLRTQPATPLSGEQMLRESAGMAQLGKRYVEGENLVSQGEDLIRMGQAKIAEGERLAEQGRRIMKESEQGYGELRQ